MRVAEDPVDEDLLEQSWPLVLRPGTVAAREAQHRVLDQVEGLVEVPRRELRPAQRAALHASQEGIEAGESARIGHASKSISTPTCMPAIESTIEAVASLVQAVFRAIAAAVHPVLDVIAHAIGTRAVLVEALIDPLAAVVAAPVDALATAIEVVVDSIASVGGGVGSQAPAGSSRGQHACRPETVATRHMSAPVSRRELAPA